MAVRYLQRYGRGCRLWPPRIQAFWSGRFLVVEHLTCQNDLGRIRRRLNALFARFHELPGRHAFDLGDEGRHAGVQQLMKGRPARNPDLPPAWVPSSHERSDRANPMPAASG